jgi:Ca2+-transporting ATPase
VLLSFADTTGTLTENKPQSIRFFCSDKLYEKKQWTEEAKKVIEINVGKPVPFDPMENATQGYQKTTTNDTRRQFSMIHEYPLDGNRP